MVERIIDELKKKGVKGEAFYASSRMNVVKFQDDKLHSIEEKEISGVGVRVIKDGKVGFASTNKEEEWKEVVEEAIGVASLGKPAKFEFPGKSKLPELSLYDENVLKIEVEEAVEKGNEIIERIKERVKDLKISVDIKFGEHEISLGNTEGFRGNYTKTVHSLFGSGFGLVAGSFLSVYKGSGSTRVKWMVDELVKEIIEKRELAENTIEIETGEYDVILSPEAVFLTLTRALLSPLNGKTVMKGASPLCGKLGEKILSDKITLIDDPLLPDALATRPFDDEGVVCRPKAFYEKGVLKNYYLDLESAHALGLEPTGNGMRNYDELPSPGYTTIILEGGERGIDEIIRDTEKGILVCGVLGGGQSNVLAGDFSVNLALAFLIEKGELRGRVKNAMFGGNLYQLQPNLRELSREVQDVYGHMRFPYMVFERVKVAGKA